MIILDTDILSILDTKSGTAFDNVVRRLGQPDVDRVAITIVSVEEQMRGWLSYIAASRTTSRQIEGYMRLNKLIRSFEQQEVLDFDRPAADIFDDLKASKVRIGPMDLKIAAITLSRDALLISRNLRDFRRVPNLLVEDWTV